MEIIKREFHSVLDATITVFIYVAEHWAPSWSECHPAIEPTLLHPKCQHADTSNHPVSLFFFLTVAAVGSGAHQRVHEREDPTKLGSAPATAKWLLMTSDNRSRIWLHACIKSPSEIVADEPSLSRPRGKLKPFADATCQGRTTGHAFPPAQSSMAKEQGADRDQRPLGIWSMHVPIRASCDQPWRDTYDCEVYWVLRTVQAAMSTGGIRTCTTKIS
jgi:hypothetical protein